MSFGFKHFILAVILIYSIYCCGCQCELTVQPVLETPCISPPARNNEKEIWNFVFGSPWTWNIVMASKSFYRKYAECFLGRPAEDCTELGQMKLTAKFVEGVLILSGYGKDIDHVCAPSNFQEPPLDPTVFNEVACTPSTKFPEVDLSTFGNETVYVAWTNLKDTIAFGKCFSTDQRMFSVWSKHEKLSSEIQDTVERELKTTGYTCSNFEILDKACSKPKKCKEI